MNALLTAIYTTFTSTSALTTAFPGGLSHGRAVKGETRPYVVFRVVRTSNTAGYSSAAFYGDHMIDFIGFSGTGANVITDAALITAMETLASTYANGVSISGATLTNVDQLSDVLPFAIPAEDERGSDEWQATVSFLFSVAP